MADTSFFKDSTNYTAVTDNILTAAASAAAAAASADQAHTSEVNAAASGAALLTTPTFPSTISSTGALGGFAFWDRTNGSPHAFQWFANANIARLFSIGSLSAVLSVTEAGDVQAPSLRLSPVSGVRAVNITQTLPSTLGALAGAVIGNELSTSIDTEVQASIDPFTGLPGEAGTPYAANWVGFQFSGSVGPNYDATGMVGNVGQAFTLSAGLVTSGANTTDSDLSCGSLGFANNYAFPNSRGYGLTLSSTVGLAGTQKELIGLEAAVSIFNSTAGAVQRRRALNLLSYGDHKASVLDAAIFVQQGNPGGEFQNLLALAGANALSTTGSLIIAEVAQTIGSVINLPLLDITDYIVNTKHGTWTGAGVGTFGSAASNGSLVIAGAAGANLPLLFEHGGSISYQVGAVAANLYITATGFGTAAIAVNASNQLSLNGHVVTTSGAPTLDDWFDQSVKTTASPQFAGINVGHVSDTTITRVSTGVIAVEGVNVLLDGGALGTPSSGTLTHCSGLPQTGVNNLGLVLISTQVASSSASIDFTGLDDTYDDYELVISSIRPATDATELMLRVGTGGTPTYQTTGYRWSGFSIVNGGSAAGGGTDTKISLTCSGTAGNDVGENTSSIVRFSNPEASLFMEAAFETRYTRSDGSSVMAIGAGAYATSGAVTALRVAFASGNIASGRISLYGRRKS